MPDPEGLVRDGAPEVKSESGGSAGATPVLTDGGEEGGEVVEIFEDDDDSPSVFDEGRVSDADLFRFAKEILGVIAILFLLLVMFRINGPEPAASEVWDDGSAALTSITTLVLGYYFGRKQG